MQNEHILIGFLFKSIVSIDFFYQQTGHFISSIPTTHEGFFAMISCLIMTAFKKIVVIGAGTMGSGIAAHLANSKRDVVLLDLKGKSSPNEISERAIDIIKKSDPPLLVEKSRLEYIKPGNLTNDFDEIKDADWIIEAVVERIDIKHQLYAQIDKVRNSSSIVSSNTSTIPLSVLTSEMSETMKSDFCITHFFNPVRFMRLLLSLIHISEPTRPY